MVEKEHRVVRRLGVAFLAGVGAGVLCGLAARLCMRLATLAAGQPGEFSWEGTTGIVVVFAIAALPGAILAGLLSGRFRWVLSILMSVLLCVPATAIASSDLGSLDGLDTARWVAVLAAAAGVYVSILALPWVTARLMGVRLSLRRDTSAAAGMSARERLSS
jgi:hypothetical protein